MPVAEINKPSETVSIEYQSVTVLKGVGPAVAGKLEKLGISTLQDVLFHLPYRYEDRTRVVPIGTLQPGQQAVIEGVIQHSEIRYSKGRGRRGSGRSLLCYLSDDTGAVLLRFFHFSKAQQAKLSPGTQLRCFGEARYGANKLEMAHPEYQHLEATPVAVEDVLTPVYPATEGVHQTLLRRLSEQVLQLMRQRTLPDWLPADIVERHQFPELTQALQRVHRPPPDEVISDHKTPARQRLIFEELLAHHLAMMQLRQRFRVHSAVPMTVDPETDRDFRCTLGFDLTGAQQRVVGDVREDVASESPMLRLVQGDVGSGKTAVAACAVLTAVHNGVQSAVMAPTEILAEQLAVNFERWFEGRANVITLFGKHKGKERERRLASIVDGEAAIVVGTHALFQHDVVFADLALVVIDEQHRFGVHQRLALRDKGRDDENIPHQLIMTATPIPRSLAMTAYADLDYSVIDELPAGRKPVSTVVIPDSRRQEVIDRVAEACASGERAFWVCTLVEESEVLQCQAAEDTASQLAEELQHLRIGLVHGRMKQQQKDDVMAHFKSGDLDLLVATTVIEVGVDVPEASLMIIENAERLGLAQLHQLRGRVGRGERQSTCVLMYHPPLSQRGKERLAILRETNDGFRIAQRDLELRGPGEVLGTRQTGLIEMRIADVVRDAQLLPLVKQVAASLQREHPQNIEPLVQRWLGHNQRFASV